MDAPPVRRASPARLAVGAVGLVLLAALPLALGAIPAGPGEFAYQGPNWLEPWPFATMRGFTAEQLLAHAAFVGLGLPGTTLLAWGLAGRPIPRLDPEAGARAPLWAAALATAFCAALMTALFRGRAIISDELTYTYQATLLAAGRLGETRLPGIDVSAEAFTIRTLAGYTGKYLFGEPLVQVPGVWIGLPPALHLVLLPATVVVFAATARRLLPAAHAWLAPVLLAASPLLVFTAATGLSHVTALFAVALALHGVVAADTRPTFGAALAGFGVGFAAAVRPQVAVPVGLVLGPWLLFTLRRHPAAVGVAVAALAPWVVGVLAYNRALTGDPLVLPWFLVDGAEQYGFGPAVGTFVHSPRTALENLVTVAVRWNAWWLGGGAGLVLLVLARPTELRHRAGVAALAGAVVLFNVGYYSPGVSDTGPVYHFELLLPAALVGAAALGPVLAAGGARAWFVVVHLGLVGPVFCAHHWARLDRLTTWIHREAETALATVTPPAVLLYEPRCDGARLAGWIWTYPLRMRGDEDPVVVYPRPPAEALAAYGAAFPGRSCWYTRHDATTDTTTTRRCLASPELTADPPPAACAAPASTARVWGWAKGSDPTH